MPKVLHRVAGTPLIEHVLGAAAALQPRIDHRRRRTSGGRAEVGARSAPGLTFVVQEPQLGTATPC